MPYEKGGKADKGGYKYEMNWIILKLLELLDEELKTVIIEPIGSDEKVTDVLIENKDGTKEHQQCKARNGSEESWTISALSEKNIFSKWKEHLDRKDKRNVSLVSPVNFVNLEDLISRALNTNDNPMDFYKDQIRNSSKKFQKLYKDICKNLELSIEENNQNYEKNIEKSIDYLKRIKYCHMSECMINQSIKNKVEKIFINTKDEIHCHLDWFIKEGNNYGKKITPLDIRNFLETYENVEFRYPNQDKKILPCLKKLNKEYKKEFSPLKKGLIERTEIHNDIIKKIEEGNSVIIHGEAGYGKSGCTMGIIEHCEEKGIGFIAVKLDKHTPKGNLLDWSKKLGFPLTIPEAINQISADKKAVIILDQLEYLQWTKLEPTEAINICENLIKTVKNLNKERKQKISIVFTCRTYDLENYDKINSLFQSNNEKELKWERIIVKKLNEEDVQKIVGEKYLNFTPKLKDLLKIPSNLYICENLDLKEKQYNITTTKDLIKEWHRQLITKVSHELTASIEEVKNILVNDLEEKGILYSDEKKFYRVYEGLKYLNSVGMLNIQEGNVSFSHQSIFDYFISEQMMEKFENGINIIEIIGNKDKQTPNRYYQIQIFLQNLLEEDSEKFLNIGEEMLNNDKVREHIKYLFYEILAQIPKEEIDEVISEYIIKNCEKENIFDKVIYGHKQYISILRDNRVLDEWFNDSEKKKKVFELLESPGYSNCNFDIGDFNFFREHSFKNIDDDKKIMSTLIWGSNICNEIDEIFNLRIELFLNHEEDLGGKFNKFLLDCFEIANRKYSNKIIKYIYENFDDNKIFNMLKSSNDKIKNIIMKHSKYCCDELYFKLENKIFKMNLKNYDTMVQKELFSCLPENRKSKKIKSFEERTVTTLVKDKELSKNKSSTNFLDNIDFVIKSKKSISKEQVEKIFDCISSEIHLSRMINSIVENNTLKEINVLQKKLEDLFLKFPCDYKSQRAKYFFDVITKRNDWPDEILKSLKDIAINHEDFKIKHEYKNNLLLNNSVNKKVTDAIAEVIKNKPEKFNEFKNIIENIITNENIIANHSFLKILCTAYNIEKEWSLEKLINLYEKNIRLINTQYFDTIFWLYDSKYKKKIVDLIKQHYNSTPILIFLIVDLYLKYNEFTDILQDIISSDKKNLDYFLKRLIEHFNEDEYNKKIKQILLKLKDKDCDFNYYFNIHFYINKIDLLRDEEFLLELMKFENINKITPSFLRYLEYLEENEISISGYADIIINLCENILSTQSESEMISNIPNPIIKLEKILSDKSNKNSKNKKIHKKILRFLNIMDKEKLKYGEKMVQEIKK